MKTPRGWDKVEAATLEERVLASPATHRWLLAQLEATRKRDPVDALNDAECLVAILKERCERIEAAEELRFERRS